MGLHFTHLFIQRQMYICVFSDGYLKLVCVCVCVCVFLLHCGDIWIEKPDIFYIVGKK